MAGVKWSWMVQPKACLLMTKISRSDRTEPPGDAQHKAQEARPARFHQDHAQDLPAGGAEGLEQGQLPLPVHDEHQKGGDDAEDRHHHRHPLQGVGQGEGLVEDPQDAVPEITVGQGEEAVAAAVTLLEPGLNRLEVSWRGP